MKGLFPHGALLSWQGYHHSLPSPSSLAELSDPMLQDFVNQGHGAYACSIFLRDYLVTGALPTNGHTCPTNGPAAEISLQFKWAKQAVEGGYCISDLVE